MERQLITPSTGPPLSLRDAQDHLYNWDDDRAPDMLRKLNAATEYCQHEVSGHRQFMPATYDGILPEFPVNNGRITLPLPPLKSITSLKYYDADDVEQTLGGSSSTTAYETLTPTDNPGFIEPVFGEVWPTTRLRADAVTVRFVAGYASRAAVPAGIKEAILLKTEHLYDPGRVNEKDMNRAIHDLMNHYEYGHYA